VARGDVSLFAQARAGQSSRSRADGWLSILGRISSYQENSTTEARATFTDLPPPRKTYAELETPYYDGDVMEYDREFGYEEVE